MYLGIDLGTSNSAVAGVSDSQPRVFKTTEGADYLPSVVYIDKRGNRLYGQRAYAQAFMSPDNVAMGFKRLMGTSTAFEFAASGETLTAEECSADILMQLVGQAITESGKNDIHGAVVTIPAAFNQMQSEATLSAARRAGLKKVALLQEPIAAAMAAMSQSKAKSGQFLVYDLGGGTFDLALVQNVSGSVNILAHEGINMLGGRDFDKAILNQIVRPWLLENFDLPQDFQRVPGFRRLMRMAAYAVEKAKIGLTTSRDEVINASEEEIRLRDQGGEDIYLQIPVERAQIEELLSESIDRTVELSRKIMKDSGYTHDDIERIVFIGGPTKMPMVRENVARELGIPADLATNPMTAVAVGAAIYCESRNWDEGGTSRKATRGNIKTKGKLSLRLDYPTRTSDNHARIKVSVDEVRSSEAFNIECRCQSGWTSGLAKLEGGMTIDIPLDDCGDNSVQVRVFDFAGRPVEEVCETLVITRVQASAAGIPATQTISVKVIEGAGSRRNMLDPLIKKGTLLPASGTKKFRATRDLMAGEQDYLELTLFQDEGVPEVELNQPVGEFRITGNDLSEGTKVQIGDTIIVKWFMSDSGLLQASLELPSVGQTFATGKYYCPQAGHQSFTLEEGTKLAQEVLEKAQSELDEAEEAIGGCLAERAEQIREKLSQQAQDLDNASAGEDTRSVTEAVRHIRQEISRVTHDPAHQRVVHAQELTRLQAGFNRNIRGGADSRITELFDQHCLNAQKALARGDDKAIREVEAHLEAMESLQMQYLLQDPRFLLVVFQDRLSKRFLSTERGEFDRLVKQGEQAIELEDIDKLRDVIFRIDRNLITTDGISSDVTKLSSLMRG